MITHTFTLPSGIECVTKEMTGKHQRILTEQKSKKMGDNLNEILADILVRVGDEEHITLEFVQAMLAADRRKALVEARMFSIGDDTFNFTWNYVDKDGVDQKLEKEVDLSEGFPTHPFATQVSTYAELNKDVDVVLPRSGETVRYRLLDGYGELIAGQTKREDRSSHTALLMRNPRKLTKTENDVVPIQMNVRDLDNLSYKDIEALRSDIKKQEGRVDTEIKFEHPDAEFLPQHEKYVVVDLLNVVAFFFPSEAI